MPSVRLRPLLLLLTVPLVVGIAAAQGNDSPGSGVQVILLGTGTPNVDPARSGPATAIVVNGEVYLVDCGPGVVRRAAAAGLPMQRLRRVFITHLHSDHTLGLPDLLFSPWVLGRTDPLQAYGPPGLRTMAGHISAAWREDVRVRLDGLEPANPTGHAMVARDVRPGIVYQDALVTVKAFAVSHGSWKHAYAYRFEALGRTIVISGDTTKSDAMIQHARGADILLHEVYCEAGWRQRPAEWQRYHQAFHTASRDLARIAAEARPRLLVLYHVLLWGASEEQLLSEMREIFSGQIVVGKDLEVFKL